MSSALTVRDGGGAVLAAPAVTEKDLELVKKIIFPDADDAELKLFLFECSRRGVHPLDRKIFPVKRNDKESGTKRVTFQTSIDLMRSEALTTGGYDGQDEPEFGEEKAGGYPESATVRVYRKGIERPFVGIARWKEFYPGDGGSGFMWRKMPYHMLSKCAEALAMRKAFPQELGGLYVPEEMQRADDAGNQGGGYSGTVRQTDKKPPGTSQAAPGATKGKKTAIDTLKEEVAAYCPDPNLQPALLKQLTTWTDAKGNLHFAESWEKLTEKWAGNALVKLREIRKASGEPEGCTKNPKTCDHSSWVSGEDNAMMAVCAAKNGADCPHDKPATGQEG